MKVSKHFRNGFGLSQIMALLLVVLPTLAFIVMLIIEYWSVMRIQNNLTLATNILSRYASMQQEAIRNWGEHSGILATASKYCPKGTTLEAVSASDNDTSQINVTVSYDFAGKFFSKTLQSSYDTFSLHDQNLTTALQCR